MHDDRREGVHGSGVGTSTNERDALAALINAAGKRATPPDEAYRQVLAAAHGAWQTKLRTRRARARRYAWAASVAFVALGTVAIIELMPRESSTVFAASGVIQGEVLARESGEDTWQALESLRTPILVGTEIRTAETGRIALTLPSNGSLRIDADSHVTILATTRFDLADGTLYVDSGDALLETPFSITTPLGTVRDIGTQFEVATEAETLRVRIRDGAVSISSSGAPADVFGSAGEQIRLLAGGDVVRDAFATYDSAWAWVETLAGAAEIEGRSLLTFLDWVARETGRELRFDTPLTESRARGVTLHGNAANLLPMQALDVVLSTTNFAYALGEDGAIIVSVRAQ